MSREYTDEVLRQMHAIFDKIEELTIMAGDLKHLIFLSTHNLEEGFFIENEGDTQKEAHRERVNEG